MNNFWMNCFWSGEWCNQRSLITSVLCGFLRSSLKMLTPETWDFPLQICPSMGQTALHWPIPRWVLIHIHLRMTVLTQTNKKKKWRHSKLGFSGGSNHSIKPLEADQIDVWNLKIVLTWECQKEMMETQMLLRKISSWSTSLLTSWRHWGKITHFKLAIQKHNQE